MRGTDKYGETKLQILLSALRTNPYKSVQIRTISLPVIRIEHFYKTLTSRKRICLPADTLSRIKVFEKGCGGVQSTLYFCRSAQQLFRCGFFQKVFPAILFSKKFFPGKSFTYKKSGNDGQDDMRGICFVMINGLLRDLHFCGCGQMSAGIGIAVESGEIAAGDLDADTVSFFECPCR